MSRTEARPASGPPGTLAAEEVREAARRLEGVVRRTPLLPSRPPGGAPEATLWLKCENFQHVSAFKARGAYHFVARLPSERREAGLVTYSSGNHAQGVAFAARAFGVPATIVMPTDAPRVKLEATRALGAEVVQEGTTSSERQERAEALLEERGGVMVPPFDHPHIIAGQGTVGLELLEQLEAAGAWSAGRGLTVLVPIGGGGLASGVAVAVRERVPEARLVGVEPEGAASMAASLRAGRPVRLESVRTVADGLKPVSPGEHTFRHCRALLDEVVTVEDEEILAALRWMFDVRLVVEPSGAAAASALLAGRVEPEVDGATVAVVSGGNVEPSDYARWIAGRNEGWRTGA